MKHFKALFFSVGLSAIPLSGYAASIDFFDDFDAGESALWDGSNGAWDAAGGVYNAALPNHAPVTQALLPFEFDGASLQIDVDVNSLADGGIWMNTDGTNQNGMLLVLGGLGYGPTGGASGGHALYWHPIVNGGFGLLGQVDNVFTTLEDYHITVKVTGSLYEAYVDGDLISSINYAGFSGGRVGLYDEWSTMTFDNFRVQGATVVPEPAAWALMLLGFGLAGGVVRGRRSGRTVTA